MLFISLLQPVLGTWIMGLGCLKEWDILMVDDASSPAGISEMNTFSKHITAFRDEDLVEEGIPEVQGKGFPLAFPGDLVLIYREGQGGEAGEGVKEEVARAYDRVASTAEIQGSKKPQFSTHKNTFRRPGFGS